MATAVKPSTEPGTSNPRLALVIASTIGALFVVAGIAVSAYLVPMLWADAVDPYLNPIMTFAFRLIAMAAVAGAIFWVGRLLAGSNPPRGLRGGIFLVISLFFTAFFIIRAVGLNIEDTNYGFVTLIVLGVVLGGSYVFLTSPRAERWMYAIEEQGWFHTFNYKKTQGLKLRRYTLIGLLLIGMSGVFTLYTHGTIGVGDLALQIPYMHTNEVPDRAWQNLTADELKWLKEIEDAKKLDKKDIPVHDRLKRLPVLPTVQYSLPVLLAVLCFWLSWRSVNVPSFADFLIATEAEMNKVSWSTRKRLIQDTIVVLVTVALLTAFLLFVDIFWGWLLSREVVGVLPPKSNTPAGATADPLAGKNIDW